MIGAYKSGWAMRLKDKVAIVTGGAHGMGEAEARLFAIEGAKILVADILGSDAERVAADIRAGGGEATARPDRCHQRGGVEASDRKAVATYGRLDILVNNAGISGSSVGDLTVSRAGAASSRSTRPACSSAPNLPPSRWRKPAVGRSSTSARSWDLSAAPAAILAIMRPRGQCGSTPRPRPCGTARPGVRVNTVHPGYMPPMLNATNAGERDDKIAATPLRRIGKPIEVAYGVLFLASDEASFITGTELVIDGGFIAQ